jgi:hypothetical protein
LISQKCFIKHWTAIGIVDVKMFRKVNQHQWYFHICNEQTSCPIQACNNFGVVLGTPEGHGKHVESHKKKTKVENVQCPIEDCPKHQERFATKPPFDTHT